MNPKHLLALALGIDHGCGCLCAVCGESPFAVGAKGLGSNFTDHGALALPAERAACKGCERLMAGRPGDDPPPLRTTSVLAHGGKIETLDRPDWWALLTGKRGFDAPAILSWATSRKRHHWLHAGLSTPDRWEVGTDHGCASWAFDRRLPGTVLALLIHGCRKAEILAGRYPAHRLTPEVLAMDAEIAPLRGHLILDLAIWAAPIEDLPERPEIGDPVIHKDDALAAELVAEIAWRASQRVEDGINFWAANGFLIRRLRRFAHKDLRALVSGLMRECGLGGEAGSYLGTRLDTLTADQEDQILGAIRERADLIAALAFDRVQGIRRERTTQPATQETF